MSECRTNLDTRVDELKHTTRSMNSSYFEYRNTLGMKFSENITDGSLKEKYTQDQSLRNIVNEIAEGKISAITKLITWLNKDGSGKREEDMIILAMYEKKSFFEYLGNLYGVTLTRNTPIQLWIEWSTISFAEAWLGELEAGIRRVTHQSIQECKP